MDDNVIDLLDYMELMEVSAICWSCLYGWTAELPIDFLDSEIICPNCLTKGGVEYGEDITVELYLD